MNLDRLKLWTDALRSGQYEQGVNVLRTKDGKYCCLGVLCEVAIANGLDVPVSERDSVKGSSSAGRIYGGCATYPPDSVLEWLGLRDHGKELGVHSGPRWVSLIYLNDHARFTFAEIADALEREYAAVPAGA